jgi:hypothetical protein
MKRKAKGNEQEWEWVVKKDDLLLNNYNTTWRKRC